MRGMKTFAANFQQTRRVFSKDSERYRENAEQMVLLSGVEPPTY